MATLISKADAIMLVRTWMRDSRAFTVKNVTKNGPRTWAALPKAGRDQIKGTGTTIMANPMMLHIFDIAVTERDKQGRILKSEGRWRTLNLATLTEIKRGDEHYLVEDGPAVFAS